jgi:hypothetical protein
VVGELDVRVTLVPAWRRNSGKQLTCHVPDLRCIDIFDRTATWLLYRNTLPNSFEPLVSGLIPLGLRLSLSGNLSC